MMKQVCIALLGLVLWTLPAKTQTVQQSGNVTQGHVATWATNGVIQDGGAVTANQSSAGASTTSITSGSTYYCSPAGCATSQSNAALVAFTTTGANLNVAVGTAPGAGQTVTATLMVGPYGTLAATTVSCTISGTNTSCSDTTNQVNIAAGQAWAVRIVTSGSAASTTGETFAVQLISTGPPTPTQPYVLQSGNITSGHSAIWTTNGVIQDGGVPVTSTIAPGPFTAGDIVYVNNLLQLASSGVPLTTVVIGPASAVSGNLPSYSGSTGKLLADSGIVAARVVTGPASVTSGNLASFNGTGGNLVQDSGIGSTTTGTGSIVLATSPTIDSPALTGVPTAPTASPGTNTTQIATTAFVIANAGGACTTLGAFQIGTGSATGCSTAGVASAVITWNHNSNTSLTLNNNSTGTSGSTTLVFNNSAHAASVGLYGTGYTAISVLQNTLSLFADSGTAGINIYNQGANPLSFYATGAFSGMLSGGGQWMFGPSSSNTTTSGTILTLNAQSGVAAPALVQVDPHGALQIVGGNSQSSGIDITTISNNFAQEGYIFARIANGTLASPTAVTDGLTAMSIGGWGWDGSGWVEATSVAETATGTWVHNSNTGMYIGLWATPQNTTSFALEAKVQAGLAIGGNTTQTAPGFGNVGLTSTGLYSWQSVSTGAGSYDTFVGRAAAANIRLGGADAASPIAQTLSIQNVVTGTSNTAGANLTIAGSKGTGTGNGGAIVFQTAPAGSTGTSVNPLAQAGFIGGTGQWSMGPQTNPLANLQSGTIAAVTGPDATVTRFAITAAGTGVLPVLNMYVSRGTVASPTANQSGDVLWGFGGTGYGTSYQVNGGSTILGVAAENFDASHGGTDTLFRTTATGSTTVATALKVYASTGLGIGAATSDPGAGGLYVSGATITLNALGTDATHTDRTVCQDTTSKSLFFGSGAAGICLGTSGMQFKNLVGLVPPVLDRLMNIPVREYFYKPGYGDDGENLQRGPTAQDVALVFPDLVRHNQKGEAINYDWGTLVFLQLRAIQELKSDNDNLRAEMTQLRKAIGR